MDYPYVSVSKGSFSVCGFRQSCSLLYRSPVRYLTKFLRGGLGEGYVQVAVQKELSKREFQDEILRFFQHSQRSICAELEEEIRNRNREV